jgi:30S ribosomal protein S31
LPIRKKKPPLSGGVKNYFIVILHRKIRANNISKEEFMGRGDKRTLKGKIFKGSFGKKRPRKKDKGTAAKTEA